MTKGAAAKKALFSDSSDEDDKNSKKTAETPLQKHEIPKEEPSITLPEKVSNEAIEDLQITIKNENLIE